MKETVSMNELDACSKRIEKQLSNLESSIAENYERLRAVESYINDVFKRVRTKLPLSYATNWEESLFGIVEMLGDVETVVEKMEEVTLRKTEL